MKYIGSFLLCLFVSAVCLASELTDGVNMSVIRATMPTSGVSAVVSPYSAVFMAGLLGDGMDNRELRIALSERLGLRTTSFGPTFMRVDSRLANWGNSNRVEVLFANSVWMRNYSRIDPEFHFMANRAYHVAFGPLVGVEAINAWSSVKTDGLVSKVLDKVDLSCDTVLVSASGFNGAWARPFPQAQRGAFHAPGGDVVLLPMMKDTRTVRMVKRPAYTAFSLMYRGEKLALYVLVPAAGRTPHDVGRALTPDELDVLDRALLPGYRPEDANGNPMPDVEGAAVAVARVVLPKFRVESTIDVIPALTALGVPRTGFDTICKDLRIGMAVQHNVFETSETGGEVGGFDLPAVKEAGKAPELVCDRPFAFLVRTVDRLTLLAGIFSGR